MKRFLCPTDCKIALSLLAVFSLFSPLLLPAAPGDEHWDAQFGWPGPGGNNYSIATHNGRIYASGLASTTNVAIQVWDGAQWSALSQVYGSVGTVIYDLAFVGNTLYAAGAFTNIDGVAVTNLAKWDGTNWSGVGFQKGTPYSLAVDGGNLYVGGGFTNVGAVAMKNVGYYDGSAWHALGAGLGDTNVSIVYAVAATNGTVYAGGSFSTSGGAPISANVAQWNGSGWLSLGSGPGSTVFALAVSGSTLYAGGQFGSSPSSGVSKWDGASWTLCGSGFNDRAQSIAILGGQVCAGGNFTTAGSGSAAHFAVWNGTSWSPAGSGVSSAANRVISTGTNLYVGGNFLLAGGLTANGLAAWDGANWSTVGSAGRISGLSSTVTALGTDGTNLYAGGSFTAAGASPALYVARFDGTNWYPLGGGLASSGTPTVNAIAVSGNNVYVGGNFTTAGGVPAANIAMWDGASWHALGSGPGGVVASITVRPDGVYAAGASYNGTVYGSPYFLRWDGSSWQTVLSYNPDDTFINFYLNDSLIGMDTAAFIGSDIYVGGHFLITWHDPTFTQSIGCPNIMRFDGTYARVVDTGLNSNAVAMAVLGGNLYVAGNFTTAGSVSASHIAEWNGSAWSALGSGVVGKGTIYSLATIGNNLYACGSFTNVGGVAVTRIAKWDGASWSALGSGLTIAGSSQGTVFALAASGNDLYAGSNTRLAGGKASLFLGRWNDQVNFNTPALLYPRWLSNHQFGARLQGVTGVTNIVQVTTNFSSWTPLLTNSTGIYDFTDPGSANNPRRFYRALLAP